MENFPPQCLDIMHRVAVIFSHPSVEKTRENLIKILENLEDIEDEIKKNPNYLVIK